MALSVPTFTVGMTSTVSAGGVAVFGRLAVLRQEASRRRPRVRANTRRSGSFLIHAACPSSCHPSNAFAAAVSSRSYSSNSSSTPPDFDQKLLKCELRQIWEWYELKAEAKRQGRDTIPPGSFSFSYYAEGTGRNKNMWYWLDREMSSNVAGECAAVSIYEGAEVAADLLERMNQNRKGTSTSTQLKEELKRIKAFCAEHRKTEQHHLDVLQEIVPKHMRTVVLPVWRVCGLTLGFLPTFFGRGRGLYCTVYAVESFVETHYQEQIQWLRTLKYEEPGIFKEALRRHGGPELSWSKERSEAYHKGDSELVRFLSYCCADEVEHKEDAYRRLVGEGGESSSSIGVVGKVWQAIVFWGSKGAALIAKRV